MCSLKTELRQIRTLIAKGSETVLDGHKYPNGKSYDIKKDAEERKEASTAVVKAHYRLLKTGKAFPEILQHLYYLARDIDPCNNYIYQEITHPIVQSRIKLIAQEGRDFGDSNKISVVKRLQTNRLFMLADYIFPAQLRDSKRGCSASICSNCYEPIAYSVEKCPCCHFELIGPFGFPEIESWQKMTKDEKRRLVERVFLSEKHGKLGIIEHGKLKIPVFSKIDELNIIPSNIKLTLV